MDQEVRRVRICPYERGHPKISKRTCERTRAGSLRDQTEGLRPELVYHGGGGLLPDFKDWQWWPASPLHVRGTSEKNRQAPKLNARAQSEGAHRRRLLVVEQNGAAEATPCRISSPRAPCVPGAIIPKSRTSAPQASWNSIGARAVVMWSSCK